MNPLEKKLYNTYFSIELTSMIDFDLHKVLYISILIESEEELKTICSEIKEKL